MQKMSDMLTKSYNRGSLHCALLAITSQTQEALETAMYGCTKVLTITKKTFEPWHEISNNVAF